MELIYHQQGDTAAVLVHGEIGPNDTADVQQLDNDRIVRYGTDGHPIEYQFFNARRLGVRVNDLEHADKLSRLFIGAGISQRTWSDPVEIIEVRRRNRDVPAG
jgi:hypothetical protein